MDEFFRIKTDTIYILTHAETVDGLLTKAGVTAAEALIKQLEPYGIDGLFSAPSAAAQATIEPFALSKALRVVTLPDLRDHRLSLQGTRVADPFLETRFSARSKARPGGETFDAASNRFRQALLAVSRRPVVAPAVVTHPGLLAALISQRDKSFGYAEYLAMPTPGIWKLTHRHGTPTAIEALRI